MRIAAAVLVVLSAAATVHAASSADNVLAKVHAKYSGLSHLRGTYRQENTRDGVKRELSGEFELARHGKFRIDDDAENSSLRSDGTNLWMVQHDTHYIGRFDGTRPFAPSTFSALAGADLAKDYTATITTTSSYGAKGTVVLQLDATNRRVTPQIFLVLDPTDDHVLEIVVVEKRESKHLYFDTLDPDTAVQDSDFVADPDSAELRGYSVDTIKL
jgi:outer membrane lipoprotein-sorting protein